MRIKYYSGQQVIDVISEFANSNDQLLNILNRFGALETADVEPIRHGEWVVDTIYPSGVKKFHCSICGQERTVHEKYEGVFRQNYCHNCGALMNKREADT